MTVAYRKGDVLNVTVPPCGHLWCWNFRCTQEAAARSPVFSAGSVVRVRIVSETGFYDVDWRVESFDWKRPPATPADDAPKYNAADLSVFSGFVLSHAVMVLNRQRLTDQERAVVYALRPEMRVPLADMTHIGVSCAAARESLEDVGEAMMAMVGNPGAWFVDETHDLRMFVVVDS